MVDSISGDIYKQRCSLGGLTILGPQAFRWAGELRSPILLWASTTPALVRDITVSWESFCPWTITQSFNKHPQASVPWTLKVSPCPRGQPGGVHVVTEENNVGAQSREWELCWGRDRSRRFLRGLSKDKWGLTSTEGVREVGWPFPAKKTEEAL